MEPKPATTDGARWRAAAVVAAVTFCAYLPVLRNQFLTVYDGRQIPVYNAFSQASTLSRVSVIFRSFGWGGVYEPLTYAAFALQFPLWGMHPCGYYFINVLFQSLSAVLVYILAMRLFGIAVRPRNDTARFRPFAVFSALLFSIHPLRVEPVAWVAGLCYLLAGVFYFAAILTYLEARGAARPRARLPSGAWTALSLCCFALSLLSYQVGVTLPAVLLVLDVYPLRRFSATPGWARRLLGLLGEKLPYALIACAVVAYALIGRRLVPAYHTISLRDLDLESRLAYTFYGLSFYIEKTIFPLRLHPVYKIAASGLPVRLWAWPCAARACAVLAVTIGAWRSRRRWPCFPAAWAAYILMVLPLAGVVKFDIREQVAADRWSYLAAAPISILAGAALLLFWEIAARASKGRRTQRGLAAGGILLIVCLGAMTWRQSLFWRDQETLFRYLMVADPADLARHEAELAFLLAHKEQWDAARGRTGLLPGP
ncbi:MAG: hypothetical protein ACHQ2Z_11445 [Elusimicrobiota bacterium]